MKKRASLPMLVLLILSLLAMGCPPRLVLLDVELPEGLYPPLPKEWCRTFGGPDWDKAYSVQQTADGGFVIAGTTWSFDAGGGDFWLIKADPQGNKEWSQTFGGPEEDRAYSVKQTACGGFMIAGWTESFGAGGRDFWLIKTDLQGNKEWSQTFGGPDWDEAHSVKQTACGGFIVAGQTAKAHARAPSLRLMGGVPPTPITCIWVVKTDAHGNIQWTQTFGTLREFDNARSVQQTACGGFIIAGMTRSFGAGKDDFWLIKLAPEQ
ncbi:hypothetical protein M1O54_00565 [Dehalococcoidia bacterium]|nr:hypothetical protein [Dehalococcoidia bacterium]